MNFTFVKCSCYYIKWRLNSLHKLSVTGMLNIHVGQYGDNDIRQGHSYKLTVSD